MDASAETRNRILKRISRVPKEKLKELDEYVAKLEDETNNKSKTLSYAGKWEDIDDSIFEDFTHKLIDNRQKSRRRINE